MNFHPPTPTYVSLASLREKNVKACLHSWTSLVSCRQRHLGPNMLTCCTFEAFLHSVFDHTENARMQLLTLQLSVCLFANYSIDFSELLSGSVSRNHLRTSWPPGHQAGKTDESVQTMTLGHPGQLHIRM